MVHFLFARLKTLRGGKHAKKKSKKGKKKKIKLLKDIMNVVEVQVMAYGILDFVCLDTVAIFKMTTLHVYVGGVVG